MRSMPRETCGYWLRKGTCKFGSQCRFAHDFPNSERGQRFHGPVEGDLPIRPGHRVCDSFARTGHCSFGPRCKYDHLARLLETKAPLGAMTRHPSHFPQRHRRMRSQQDMRRFKSFYQDPGRLVSSKGWQSAGSENSPRPCTDTSPRSTIDANGTFRHSVSPQSTHQQTSPQPRLDVPMPCFPVGGYITQDPVESGHHLANLFHPTVEQNGNTFASFYNPEFLSWPFIPSQWYGSGVPNEVMQRRVSCEEEIKTSHLQTTPSHFLKPYRSQEGTFPQY